MTALRVGPMSVPGPAPRRQDAASGPSQARGDVLGARSPGADPRRSDNGCGRSLTQLGALRAALAAVHSGTRRALQRPTAPRCAHGTGRSGSPDTAPDGPKRRPHRAALQHGAPRCPTARTSGASQTSPSRLRGSLPAAQRRKQRPARSGRVPAPRTAPARRHPPAASLAPPARPCRAAAGLRRGAGSRGRGAEPPPVLTSSKRDPTLAVTSSTPAPAAAPFTAMAPGGRAEARNGAAGSPGAGTGRCGARAAGPGRSALRLCGPRRSALSAHPPPPRCCRDGSRRRRLAPGRGAWQVGGAGGGRGGRGGTGRAGLGRALSSAAAPGSAGGRRGGGRAEPGLRAQDVTAAPRGS